MLNILCDRSQLPAGTTAFLLFLLRLPPPFLVVAFLLVVFLDPLPYYAIHCFSHYTNDKHIGYAHDRSLVNVLIIEHDNSLHNHLVSLG